MLQVMLGAKASAVKGMLLNVALHFKGKEVDRWVGTGVGLQYVV